LGCQPASVPIAWISPSVVVGAVAGMVSTISCYLLEMLKVGKIIQEEGIEAFYKGLPPTI